MTSNKIPPASDKHEEILVGFLEDLRTRGRTSSTLGRKGTQLRIFLRWCESRGFKDLGSVRQRDLVSHLAEMKARGASVGGLATAAADLRTFFRYLFETRKTRADPGVGLKGETRKGRLPRMILTREEVKRLLESVPRTDPASPADLRDRAILELLYSSALRRSEVVRLDLTELDLAQRQVFIRDGKGGKDRVVPLGRVAAEWISRYLAEGRPRQNPPPQESAVFLGSSRRMGPETVKEIVLRTGYRAGLARRVFPHSLRATCASHMLWEGADIREIAEMLGHASIRVTASYCAPGKSNRWDPGVVSTPRA